ncbi:hypothetical protein GCM10028895_51780 [Pontibacter rugosus]
MEPNKRTSKQSLGREELSDITDDAAKKKEIKQDGYNLPGDVKVDTGRKAIKVDLGFKENWNLIAAFCILAVMLTLEYGFGIEFHKLTALIINAIAYLLAGYKVLDLAFRKASRGDFFNEFFNERGNVRSVLHRRI